MMVRVGYGDQPYSEFTAQIRTRFSHRLCNPGPAHPTTDQYFNTSCFMAALPFTLPTDSITEPNLRDYGRANFDYVVHPDAVHP